MGLFVLVLVFEQDKKRHLCTLLIGNLLTKLNVKDREMLWLVWSSFGGKCCKRCIEEEWKVVKQRQTIGLRQTEKSCLTLHAEPIAWLKVHENEYLRIEH